MSEPRSTKAPDSSMVHLAQLISCRISENRTTLPTSVGVASRLPSVSQQSPAYHFTVSPAPPPDCTTLARQRWAVSRFVELLISGQIESFYDAYRGISAPSVSRPEAVGLFGALPSITPHVSIEDMTKWGIWEKGPAGVEELPSFTDFPRYLRGRQVLVVAPVYARVDAQSVDSHRNVVEDYLSYKSDSPDVMVTHRASVCGVGPTHFDVHIDMPSGCGSATIKVPHEEIFRLNEPTNFVESGGGVLTFEDGIRCRYTDFLTKAKLLEAALAIRHLAKQLDFRQCIPGHPNYNSKHAATMLEIQLACVREIDRVMDCVHFVAEGKLDPHRYSKLDVGRLALHGRGHCHTVASVIAALLIPFANLIGVEVRFRAGFFQMTNRDIDSFGNIMPSWDGKPRNTDDHTWLEVTFIPSLQSFVCDPSFSPLLLTLDECYSRYGMRHPSAALQCGSRPPAPPHTITSSAVSLPASDSGTGSRHTEHGDTSHAKLNPIDWTTDPRLKS
ncbi:kinesin motor domain protein [Pelomyxa schiedti]|nr:kinesin motor domain protein [Pelomyxa schiedti]